MKTLILAAGYATRLYPLTENFPKPLLEVGNRTILDWLIDDIATSNLVDEYIVISNHRFVHHFEEWANAKRSTLNAKLSILDDGTSTNETRLGAVRDIQLAIDQVSQNGKLSDCKSPDGYLVIAGDNLLDFSLTRFMQYALKKGTSCIMRYEEPSRERLLKCGVVTVDDDDLVKEMTEKSPEPATHWACPPFYYYTAEDAQLVTRGIEQGCGIDAPGSYIAWLCRQVPVHAMQMPGSRYDIGNLESYKKVQQNYKGIMFEDQSPASLMSMNKVDLNGKAILVTGAAGFIGSNLVKRLFKDLQGATIVGIDNMNAYYDVSLKEYRLKEIDELLVCQTVSQSGNQWSFVKGSIADRELVNKLFGEYKFDVVVNLAAQAGVRYSIENPDVYIESNIIGFYNILEACRHHPVQHLVYASSSSVYGGNKKVPFSVEDRVDNPVSLYAATKKSNELFAHCYSKLYDIPTTGLRFFTVYGPAGRPDMAYFGFTNKLLKGETIQIFNYGNCRRDFTYVDDIVEGIMRVMSKTPEKKTGEDGLPVAPYAIYNIGGGQPENLLDFVRILQEELLRAGVLLQDYDFEAHKQLVPMQPGDVPTTYADASALERDFGFVPKIPLREGLRRFAEWYKSYYRSDV